MPVSSPRFSRSFLLTLAGIATLLLVFYIVNFSRFNRARSYRGPWCIANLRTIQGAKEQWALEHKIAEFSPIDLAAVAVYIKGVLPPCPKGGTYRYNAVGIPPQCIYPNHFMDGPDSCASNLRILNDALRIWHWKNPITNAPTLLGTDARRFFKEVGLRPECPFNGKYTFDPKLGAMRCNGAHQAPPK